MLRSAPAIMRASKPAPAITAKCSPFTVPVSMTRRAPCRPTRTAALTSSEGTPRFVASRLAVPAGRIAMTAPVPATASIQRWTVPSPPQTIISAAPSAAARRAYLGALRLLRTSYQSGSATPSCASTWRSSGSPPPKLLRACATTATFGMGGLKPCASGPRKARKCRRRSGRARPPAAEPGRTAGRAA